MKKHRQAVILMLSAYLVIAILLIAQEGHCQPTFPNDKNATHTYQFTAVNGSTPWNDSAYRRRLIKTFEESIYKFGVILDNGKDSIIKTDIIRMTVPNDTVWVDFILYFNPAYDSANNNKVEPILARMVQWLTRVIYPDGYKYFDHTGTFYNIIYGETYDGIWINFKPLCK